MSRVLFCRPCIWMTCMTWPKDSPLKWMKDRWQTILPRRIPGRDLSFLATDQGTKCTQDSRNQEDQYLSAMFRVVSLPYKHKIPPTAPFPVYSAGHYVHYGMLWLNLLKGTTSSFYVQLTFLGHSGVWYLKQCPQPQQFQMGLPSHVSVLRLTVARVGYFP